RGRDRVGARGDRDGARPAGRAAGAAVGAGAGRAGGGAGGDRVARHEPAGDPGGRAAAVGGERLDGARGPRRDHRDLRHGPGLRARRFPGRHRQDAAAGPVGPDGDRSGPAAAGAVHVRGVLSARLAGGRDVRPAGPARPRHARGGHGRGQRAGRGDRRDAAAVRGRGAGGGPAGREGRRRHVLVRPDPGRRALAVRGGGAAGRPIVVNLSLGGMAGPHDGTTLFEQALDSLVGPGRLLVVSAGNEGSNGNTTPPLPAEYRHGAALPVMGAVRDFVFEVPAYTPSSGTCNDVIGLEVWHEAEDRLEVTVQRPDGSGLTAAHGTVEVEDAGTGRIHIDNASGGPDPENEDHQVWIQVSDCGTSGPPAAGSWTVRVRATAAASGEPYHLWITDTG